MFLDDIMEKVTLRYNNKSASDLIPLVNEKNKKNHSFYKALKNNKINLICEIKKASPSKGIISEKFDYLKIAKEYELSNASAISCLTEPYYFLGKDEYLINIKKNVNIPVLRKDFIKYEYQIYESFLIDADAVLLICAILTDEELIKLYNLAETLGLDSLVEVHNLEELNRALKINPKIIGVNNRDLKTFNVDINTSINLKKYISDDIIFVSESGIKTKEDILRINPNACLIGESLMRSSDVKQKLSELL